MWRARQAAKDPARPVTSFLPDVDPDFRDEPDPDPVVEAMVERLRMHLSGMVALDEYNRPVAWRNVVRLALGPSLARLQADADSYADLERKVITLPSDPVDHPGAKA